MTSPDIRTLRRRLTLGALAALALGALAGCGPAPDREIPVLMYHDIAPDPGDDVWTVATAEFRRQIAGLKAAGFETILPQDLEPRRRWKLRFKRKPILLTFDDGLLSARTEAEPVLHEAGYRAVCYLITGSVADIPAERRPYRGYPCLTWEEVRAMQERGTFVFGLHSHSHTQNPVLQAREVAECRRLFRRRTGRDTRAYCYPHGLASESLVQAVAAAGYRTAMISDDQMLRLGPGTDLLRISRVSIYGGRHDFAVEPLVPAEDGALCAQVQNRGRPLPVRARLFDKSSGQIWPLQPQVRLGPAAQSWCWTNLPSGLATPALQVEIWEQNGLFRYFP